MQPLGIARSLAEAAQTAWQGVASRKDRHAKVGRGAGGNLTSKADAALEEAILKKAKELGIAVLSEEAGLVERESKWLAVVDPLDGSRNAGRGVPLHCVSVAIAARDGRLSDLVAGVVINLVTGERYEAAAGKGATKDGTKVARRDFDPEEVMVGLIADYSDSEIEETRAHSEHHIRDLGSAALEMCLVGCGALDAFVVRKPWLRVVDIAAGVLFVREAGGRVLDPVDGKDLDCALDLSVRTGVLAAHSAPALDAVESARAEAEARRRLGAVQAAGTSLPLPEPPLRWGIVGKASIPHVRKEACWLRDYLVGRGQTVLLEKDLAEAEGEPPYSLQELDKKADLFLTVGGDGTLLMTLGATEKPVFGVNAGAIGFLAEVEPPQAAVGIDEILQGRYRIEERDRLATTIDGAALPDATNEVTLQTSRIAKLIQFRVLVDGELLDILRGDGIIVSTATGSTGYAMSVGGPLVHPAVQGTVLAPIAPFRLAARPWVVPSDATVELQLLERDSAPDDKTARVVIDGQHGTAVGAGSVVRITPSPRKARFVRLGSGFYERVRTKLTR